MLKHTFCLLPGIGRKLEYRLWQSGILTWEEFLAARTISFVRPVRKLFYDDCIREALHHLSRRNIEYFAGKLPPDQRWRLFDLFRDNAVALDIETNGAPVNAGGYVTVVGLYNGADFTSLVRGDGLTAAAVQTELSRYPLLLSFYGSAFDLPFLQDSLNVYFSGLHIDLCFVCKYAGLKGGLKRIERQLGLARNESVQGLDGYGAVKLWRAARRGDRRARELLITYNRCDTVNLFPLAEALCALLKKQTGITSFIS